MRNNYLFVSALARREGGLIRLSTLSFQLMELERVHVCCRSFPSESQRQHHCICKNLSCLHLFTWVWVCTRVCPCTGAMMCMCISAGGPLSGVHSPFVSSGSRGQAQVTGFGGSKCLYMLSHLVSPEAPSLSLPVLLTSRGVGNSLVRELRGLAGAIAVEAFSWL